MVRVPKSKAAKQPPVYLLLDPSLSCYGWAVVQGEKLLDAGSVVTAGERHVPAYVTEAKRIQLIVTELSRVIVKYRPDLVVREEFLGGQGANAVRALALVKGATLATLLAHDLECIAVSPTDNKLRATNDPKASKNDMVKAARAKFTVDQVVGKISKDKLEGVCDAVCLWFALQHTLTVQNYTVNRKGDKN